MNKYLLLRDNKQTGPYSKDELAAKGLKPYDLVWLEGKSAAWRYPSELEELKSFAPVVEEQPYDRFYKKPSSTNTDTNAPIAEETLLPVAEKKMPAVPVQEVRLQQPAVTVVNKTGKRIYVTMPVKPATENPVTPARKTQEVKPVEQSALPVAAPVAAVDQAPAYEAASVAANWQQKTAAYEKTGAGKVTTPKSTGKINQPSKTLVFSLAAACILLIGVVIGLVISNTGSEKSVQHTADMDKMLLQQLQEREKQQQTLPAVHTQPVVQEPVSVNPQAGNQVPDNTTAAQQQPASVVPVQPQQPAASSTTIKKETPKKDKEAISSPVVNSPVPPVVTEQKDPTTETVQNGGVRSSTRRDDKPAHATVPVDITRKKLQELVSVEANKYKTGVLGGISDLELTIANNSGYALDEVVVEIKYLGPEKHVVKTQSLLFNDIAANGKKTLEAPRTNRGVTVAYLIKRINSRALGIAAVEN